MDYSAVQRSPASGAVRIVAILALVVVLGLGLLYAYRAQTPAIRTVPMTQAISDVLDDRVKDIVIENDRATLALADGTTEQTATGRDADQALLQAVSAHNRDKPGRQVTLRYANGAFEAPPVVSVLLALLPILLLAALVLFAAYVFARSRRGDAYEQLARIADLRDRGVLTEDEFQREKRRLLR